MRERQLELKELRDEQVAKAKRMLAADMGRLEGATAEQIEEVIVVE
jgi:hypothetical protein